MYKPIDGLNTREIENIIHTSFMGIVLCYIEALVTTIYNGRGHIVFL